MPNLHHRWGEWEDHIWTVHMVHWHLGLACDQWQALRFDCGADKKYKSCSNFESWEKHKNSNMHNELNHNPNKTHKARSLLTNN